MNELLILKYIKKIGVGRTEFKLEEFENKFQTLRQEASKLDVVHNMNLNNWYFSQYEFK